MKDSATTSRAVIKDEWSCMSLWQGQVQLYFYLFTHDAGTKVVTALKLLLYYALTAAHVCTLYPTSYG